MPEHLAPKPIKKTHLLLSSLSITFKSDVCTFAAHPLYPGLEKATASFPVRIYLASFPLYGNITLEIT